MSESDKNNISRSDVDPIYFSDLYDAPDVDISKYNIKSSALEAYRDSLDIELSFWFRLRRFLTAQNEAGRIASVIKDFSLIFIPYGTQIKNLTDLIGNFMARKKKEEESKTPIKSKTVIVFGILFVAGLLQSVGVLPESIEVAQGQDWVAMVAGVVGMAVRMINGKPIKLRAPNGSQ